MKSNCDPENKNLSHEKGIELLLQFRKGLTRRSKSLIEVSDVSETCRELTEMLLPYYEAFPDIRHKAEEVVVDSHIYGLEEMFGDVDIYPESYEPWAGAAQY